VIATSVVASVCHAREEFGACAPHIVDADGQNEHETEAHLIAVEDV